MKLPPIGLPRQSGPVWQAKWRAIHDTHIDRRQQEADCPSPGSGLPGPPPGAGPVGRVGQQVIGDWTSAWMYYICLSSCGCITWQTGHSLRCRRFYWWQPWCSGLPKRWPQGWPRILQRLRLSAGLGMPWNPLRSAGRGGCGKRCLGLPAQSAAPATSLQNKQRVIDGWKVHFTPAVWLCRYKWPTGCTHPPHNKNIWSITGEKSFYGLNPESFHFKPPTAVPLNCKTL